MFAFSTTSVTNRVQVNTAAPCTVCAPSADREFIVVHNETGVTFVKLGSGASPSNYTYRLSSNAILELPGWKGSLTAAKATGSGWLTVTEAL